MSLSKELESAQEGARDLVDTLIDRTRIVVTGILLGAWSLLWLAVLGLGWALDVPLAVQVSAGVVGATWAGVALTRAVRRRRLVKDARWSLIARARLAKLGLGRQMLQLVHAFDLASSSVQELLAAPEIAAQAERHEATFDAVRDRLFQLIQDEGRLRAAARGLRQRHALDATRTAAADLERDLSRVRDEADRITVQAQQFAARLGEIRVLAIGDSGHPPANLEDALVELDRTAAAYREIDRGPTPRRLPDRQKE